ncbi:MAG: hypothetical protein QOJ23_1654 [Actinomycetota bacterium]|jgi:hypothetical protein|nr:hypothetical protein [Actinomycetota bacterium]MDQ1499318.1 hypothetical protein [Actinomycetota bacterium]
MNPGIRSGPASIAETTPFAAATSHRIDEIGPAWLRKDLRPAALLGEARTAKPAFVHDPRREPAAYRELLRPLAIGPHCQAAGDDWIVIERVPGVELWQIGELDVWVRVAAWVARMHHQLAASVPSGHPVSGAGRREGPSRAGRVPLLVHDARLFAAWRKRAAAAGAPGAVLAAHRRATERLLTIPPTVVHGELYPSNILVRMVGFRLDVWPVDWELAGLGPAVLDVAALTAGGWAQPEREAMARAYFDAAGRPADSWTVFRGDLDAARLHLCVQWLGWAPGWTPPAEHAHGWLEEALNLTEMIP